MLAEKEDTLAEMHKQMVLAPLHFYQEIWSGMLRGDFDGGVSKAFCAASRKMTTPYTSRVGANRKRLSKG